MQTEIEKGTDQVVESAVLEAEPTDQEIKSLAADIEVRLRRGDARLEIGQLVRERYYADSVASFRSRGAKPDGLRKIARLVGRAGHVRISVSQLHRAVAVAFQRDELNQAANELSFSQQVELLRVEDATAKRSLAKAAVDDELTVRALRQAVDDHLEVERPGRASPLESVAKAAEGLRDRLQRLQNGKKLSGEEEALERIITAMREALALVGGGVPTSGQSKELNWNEEKPDVVATLGERVDSPGVSIIEDPGDEEEQRGDVSADDRPDIPDIDNYDQNHNDLIRTLAERILGHFTLLHGSKRASTIAKIVGGSDELVEEALELLVRHGRATKKNNGTYSLVGMARDGITMLEWCSLAPIEGGA